MMGLVFTSCVEEYKVPKKMTQAYESTLVIQGQILSGDNSVIYLNNTVPLGQVERPEPIFNADVTVIGQNGYESAKAEFDIDNDRYVIPTHNLPNNTQYAIKVVLDGETYQSEYQPLLSAKAIDDFRFQEVLMEFPSMYLHMEKKKIPPIICGRMKKIGNSMQI